MIIENSRGRSRVPAYRIYKLDGDGRFSAAEWIEANDDDCALAAVRSSAMKAPSFELWQGNRLVARIKDMPPDPASS